MKNKVIFNVFLREKPAMMLVSLKNAKGGIYASSLAKSIDCTYSHVVKILQEMQKAGLITFEKQGRLKLLTLTKTGAEVADRIDVIRILIEENAQEACIPGWMGRRVSDFVRLFYGDL